MSSQLCDADLFLQKMHDATFLKEIEVNLPSIIVFIEKNHSHKDFASVLRILFKDGISMHSLESVQSLYLQDVLEATRNIFCNCLENTILTLAAIQNRFPGDEEAVSVKKLLTVALDILDGYTELLNWLLSKAESIEAGKLQCVPKNLVTVLHNAFSHCRDSETTYGEAFNISAELLSKLFKKSFDVQTNLMRLLDEKLIFNCNFENDLSLLSEVLEKVSGVGEIVVGMELKAAVDQWKIFAKLACKHAYQLKPRLDLGITLSSLISTLQHVIQTVTSNQAAAESAAQMRYLKLGNFILKIIIKLCELYSGYLGECHKNILELLINLNKCDQQLEEGTELYSGFRSYLSVGSLPLLTHLLPDRQFVCEFKKLPDMLPSLTSDAKLGCFALTVNIMRKLLKSTLDIQKLWWNENLLQNIVIIVKECCFSLEIITYFDDKEGYSLLVASTSILMASILVGNDFYMAERILFSTLCQGEFYSAMFAQDLLCLLARLTKENVVVGWLEWLKKIIALADGPVKVHMSILQKRLLNFLSPKTLSTLQGTPPVEKDFTVLPQLPCITDFNFIIEKLSNVTPEDKDISKMCKWICELWQAVVRCRPKIEVEEKAIRGLHWWTLLVNRLSLASRKLISHFNDAQLIKVLDSMRSIVDGADSYCKASCSTILPRVCPILSSRTSLKTPVANLACFLCSDNDQIVVQLTLEALSPFLVTGDLYTSMVTQMPALEDVLAPYLAKRPQTSDNGNDFDLFDSLTSDEYYHNCSTRPNDVEVEVSKEMDKTDVVELDPPAKKVKLYQEFDSLITQGTLLCSTIDKYLASNILNQEQISKLDTFIRDVSNLKKSM